MESPHHLLIKPQFVDSRYDIRKGQIAYMHNTGYYPAKHINGEVAGFNLLCEEMNLKSEKFLGFGLPSSGRNIKQIDSLLLEEYNKEPWSMQMVTNKIATKIYQTHLSPSLFMSTEKRLAQHQMTESEFKETGGGNLRLGVVDFDVERIMLLAQSSEEEATQLMSKWKNTKSNV